LGRAALDYVADVDLIAHQVDALFLCRALDHLREQLSGAADERDALRVFIGAGAFADEHQRRFLVADAEDDFVAAFVQAAAAAIADVLYDLEQRVVGGRERWELHGRWRWRWTNGLRRGNRLGDRRRLGTHDLPAAIDRLDSEILVKLEILAQRLRGHCVA